MDSRLIPDPCFESFEYDFDLPSRKLTYPPKNGTFEDVFPFPKVGYVKSLEGTFTHLRPSLRKMSCAQLVGSSWGRQVFCEKKHGKTMRESEKSTNIEWNGNNLWDSFGLVYYSQKNICICVCVCCFLFEITLRELQDKTKTVL